MKTKLTLLLPFVLMMNLLESHPGRTDELGGHKEGMLGKYHIHHNNDPIFTSESKLRKLEDFKSMSLKVLKENMTGGLENWSLTENQVFDCEFSYKYRISDEKFICTIKISRKDESVNVYNFFNGGERFLDLRLKFKDKDNIPVREYGLHTKDINRTNKEGYTMIVISKLRNPDTIEYLFTFGYDLVSYIGIEEVEPRLSYNDLGIPVIFEILNTNK